jgi:hypothetical protein
MIDIAIIKCKKNAGSFIITGGGKYINNADYLAIAFEKIQQLPKIISI